MSCRLRQSVGSGLTNHKEDVATVQFLLSHIPAGEGGTPNLSVDGTFGTGTGNAIKTFQNLHFGVADGRMDPGEIAMLRLESFARANNGDEIFARARHKVASVIGFSAAAIDSFRAGADGGLVLLTNTTRNIYSHHLHGTWEVDGDLLGLYEANGEEGGQLGYPITGERNAGGIHFNWFERGKIFQNPGSLADVTFF